MRSLVLLGHGSHTDAEAALPMYRIAEAIRQRGLYEEVIEGFWKEEPSLRMVLKTVLSTDVTVIPLLISEGYITEQVFPREMGLTHHGPVPPQGISRVLSGRQVRYTQPYGLHPMMSDLVHRCAQETLAKFSERASNWTLILLAQRQARYQAAEHPAEQHAQRLLELGVYADVQVVYTEQLQLVWPAHLQQRQRIVVPFWGSALGPQDLTDDAAADATVLWARAVGTHAGVIEVIAQIARQHELPPERGDFHAGTSEAWEALLEWLHGQRRLGEVLVRELCGLYELRHSLDEGRQNSDLRTVVSAEGLCELLRFDNAGRYRPVRAWRDLPTGWRAVVNVSDLRRSLHYLYPAVVEESYLHHQHSLHTTPWATTARRQTGAYAKVQKASEKQVQEVVRRVCSGCLKTPLWADQALQQTIFDGVGGAMPCAEACSFVVDQLSGQLDRRGLSLKRL